MANICRFRQFLGLALWALTAMIALSPAPCFAYKLSPDVGIGAMFGETRRDAPGIADYAFVVDGNNHFQQRKTVWGIQQYGFSQSRLELGSSVGISLDAVSGITVLGLRDRQKVSPFIGAEAFNGRIVVSTRDERREFYEWLPMASAGIQFQLGACRFLPVAKAGGALGNITKTGLMPALGSSVGAAAHLNCGRSNLAGNWVEVRGQGQRTQLGTVDFSLAVAKAAKVGLRTEWIGTPGKSPEERRFLMLLQGAM